MDGNKQRVVEGVTRSLSESVQQIIAPRIPFDVGEIRKIEQKETEITFALYEIDEITLELKPAPSRIWTIEITTESTEDW